MRCRKNVRSLDQDARDNYVKAIKALKGEPSILHPGTQSRYDDFVEVHLGAMNAALIDFDTTPPTLLDPGWAHFDSAFFPWHRELLYRFETELDAQVPGVTIPYWDWTRERASGDLGFPFKHIFIGVDGNNANSDRVEREAGAPSTYPYEFDPDAWSIVVKDDPGPSGEPDFLTRDFGSLGSAPNLPENDSVVTGVNVSYLQAIGVASYLSLRAGSEDIHNLVHRWVAGNMVTASSPNDPVFWMHHAAIDRMWSIWQQKNPTSNHYQHTNNWDGHRPGDTLIFNEPGDTAPWSGTATPLDVIDSHAMHGESIWYETDVPDIVLESPSTIDFGPVPQDMTQYRAVHFRVRTCRPFSFRISGTPTGNFGLTSEGADFPVVPDPTTEWQDVYVWVQFEATSPSSPSGLTVEAFMVDTEGYYAAAEDDPFQLGTWNFTLEASIVPRENASVVLVLDRSYSMSGAAGGTNTRSGLMKTAVGIFHALLRPNEEFGVVSFDDVSDDLLPLTTQSAGLGTTLTGSGLDPRGNTGIGLGIQAAASMLTGATHTNTSMVVLTDGNENVHPYVDELPAGTVTNRTYAIGFGLPGNVSDDVLNRITANTGGDLIISGTLDSEQERFLLTKYFVQILAGVTSANVILDPEGSLRWGDVHNVEFNVAETDVSIDVIALSPLTPLLRFRLHTPDGSVIDPATAAGEPNVEFRQHPDTSFYRIDLPALAARPNTHAGRWIAEFQLADPDEVKKWIGSRETHNKGLLEVLRRGSLPYSCIVHTRSNLDMQASVVQPAFAPNNELTVRAVLSEYGVPYRGSASVWATVTQPGGATARLDLSDSGDGEYEATYTPRAPGLYRFRVQAAGATSGGHQFTREHTLSRGVFIPDPAGTSDVTDWLDERDRRLCELIICLISGSKGSLRDWKAEGDMDLDTILRCLEAYCAPRQPEEREGPVRRASVSPADLPDAFSFLRQELLKIDIDRLFDSTPDVVDRLGELADRRARLEELRNKPSVKTAHHAGFMLQPIEPHEKGGLPKGLQLPGDDSGKRTRKKKKSD